MLNIVKETIDEMNNSIIYCHFKSNEHLNESVDGKTDFDLLIKKECQKKFEEILLKHDFKRVNSQASSTYPGVDNWIGFDEVTGSLIHFHVHYELVTGLAGFKNYILPWKEYAFNYKMLNKDYNIYTVSYEFELIELYTRLILKQNILDIIKSIICGFNIKKHSLKEYTWLKERIQDNKLDNMFNNCYPITKIDFIKACFNKQKLSRSEYIKLRHIILKYFALFNRRNTSFIYIKNLIFKIKNKFKKSKFKISNKTSTKSGLIISFLGVDGSGKTTISNEITKWLSWKYSVYHISLGIGREKNKKINKIKSSIKKQINNSNNKSKSQTLKTAIKFWNFSKKINKDIKRINNYRYNGGIVITDRYPQTKYFGISDGPKIIDKYKKFSKYERRNLDIVNIVEPDIVFKLIAPVEVSLERRPDDNEDLLRRKYEILKDITYDKSIMVSVDAKKSVEEEILYIKKEIWKLL